jgi:hypothetical protein
MSDWVNRIKVSQINALIDKRRNLLLEQVVTLTMLQRSIDDRMVHGELRREDIQYIKDTLDRV